jgi:hypothetical protein
MSGKERCPIFPSMLKEYCSHCQALDLYRGSSGVLEDERDENDRFIPQVVENQTRRLRVRVFVEKHPDFERSDGALVERSWLRLQALPPDDEHIGLGAMKCRAISELEEELKRG